MRGGGWLLDLALMGLAAVSMIGWFYLWLLCVNKGEKLLTPVFGTLAPLVTVIGFPFVFFGLLAGFVRIWGKPGLYWFFGITAVAALVAGVQLIARKK